MRNATLGLSLVLLLLVTGCDFAPFVWDAVPARNTTSGSTASNSEGVTGDTTASPDVDGTAGADDASTDTTSDGASTPDSPDDSGTTPYPSCTGIHVSGGSDLQGQLDAHPQGTTFCLASGVYRVSSPLRPKNSQAVVAIERRQAVLTGSGSTIMAFEGDAIVDVTVRGLVVEEFATPNQGGLAAVKTGNGWAIEDNEIRDNASTGLYHGSDVIVRRNYIHHNGVFGLGGFKSSNAVIAENEVSYNAVGASFDGSSGGAKWVGTKGITITNNYFHHNEGTGIWLDGDNLDVLVENNTSNYNIGAQGGHGIQYEISCAGVVRGNTTAHNEENGIIVVASRNVVLHDNTVRSNAKGITVSHQERGEGPNCEWSLENVVVRDNLVQMDRGYSGLTKWQVGDGDDIFAPDDKRVTFTDNTYHLDSDGRYFHFMNNLVTAEDWRGYGQDVSGTFIIE